jgi:hypothetical protein
MEALHTKMKEKIRRQEEATEAVEHSSHQGKDKKTRRS